MEIEISKLRVADLGFPEGALTREIIGSDRDQDIFGNSAPFHGGRAQQLGLELCPGAIGPELRIQYTDQPLGERIYIGMIPITASDGEPRIFVIAHDCEGKLLDAARARPDDYWGPESLFIFSLGIRSGEGSGQ
jgi:hypothetical protein